MSTEKAYDYFDAPDGEDVFKKLWFVMKETTPWAIGLSIVDVVLRTKPKGYLPTLGRVAFISTPIFASTAAFVIVSNSLCAVRKQDDKLNWFLGGFASGSVFGAWNKSRMLGFNLGVAIGLAMLAKKIAVENNYTMFPSTQHRYHGTSIHDWTLTKERPGNWTTGN